MKILAIETSCDETAVSVVRGTGGFRRPKFKVLAHQVSSQVKLHAPYGGVVPSLAKREHLKNLPTVLGQALAEARITEPEKMLDIVAVTQGPGLEPALWTGINFASDLAAKWQKPLVAIDHMEGHFFSPLANDGAKITFPALGLLISGGHTELVLSKNWLKYEVLGQTRDDAVGEAFDKVARILGLPYPGGPEIGKLAAQAGPRSDLKGAQGLTFNFTLPRPMINSGNLDFSFSGLKTAVLYLVQKNPEINKAQVAQEFQQAIIDVLLAKTTKAIEQYSPETLIIGGGVANNQELIKQFKKKIAQDFPDLKLLTPEPRLTTDNATMIAAAGYFHTLKKHFRTKIEADGNLML